MTFTSVWNRLLGDPAYPYKVDFWQECRDLATALNLHADMIDWLSARDLLETRDYERAPVQRDGKTNMTRFLFVFQDQKEAALFKLHWV